MEKRDHCIVGTEINHELCLDTFGENLKKDIDYVRYQTFQLVVREIKKYNISGAVAEAGVFRGDFAQYINFTFPEKKLYLFDSFESFEKNESLYEVKTYNMSQSVIEFHKRTNDQIAMEKMKYKNNVVIKKGFIPDTFKGLENEKYCFVSLDVDFEKSILAGLRYFYPALEKGGYIFVHDYNSSLCLGVEKVVAIYEQEIGHNLCKVPICDINGTLVITK